MAENVPHTSKLYTLHEGAHKNVLPPFPITRFLRLVGSAYM